MKILAINGSYRGCHGFTNVCLNKIFDGARNKGATCETVNLSELNITECTGCQICHSTNHYKKCVYDEKDDVRKTFDMMKEADIIIYATPVYIFTMSAIMKKFLDRLNSTGDSARLTLTKKGLLFHDIDHAICSKPFVTLVCCDNFEEETTKNIIDYFKIYSSFMDAEQVGCIIRRSCGIIDYGRNPEKEKAFPKIFKVYKALYDAGHELATTGRIRASTQRQTNRTILPIPLTIEFLMTIKPFRRKIIKKIYEREAFVNCK